MMYSLRASLLVFVVVALLSGGCRTGARNPAEAQTTYGASIDAIDAIPVPAVAAERDRYAGRRLTVDGRIVGVDASGCVLHLGVDGGPPPRLEAARGASGACAWQVPAGSDGFAVATGTLRVAGDTLRLTANGVQVTPVQGAEPESSSPQPR